MSSKCYRYSNNFAVNDSFLKSWIKTVTVIWKFKWLIWMNFKADFIWPYKKSFFGGIWSIILPLVPVTAYLFLGYIRVLKVRSNVPFALYIISGMTFWLFFREGISAGMNSVSSEEKILDSTNLPIIVVIISKYGRVCANTILRVILLMVVLNYYKFNYHMFHLLVPIYIIPILLFIIGSGIILSFLNTISGDVNNIVGVFLSYGMFFSSVVFPMPTEGIIGQINSVNIFNHFIVNMRNFILYGHFVNPKAFLISSVIALLVFIYAIKFQHNMQYKIKSIL